jgi:hypothetical protein
MKKIPRSPQKIPRDFKEGLPNFSGDDLITIEDHLDAFLCTLEPYDQHEFVRMRLFSYTLVERDKEWYDSIFEEQSQVGISFKNVFPKDLEKPKITSPFMINSITKK